MPVGIELLGSQAINQDSKVMQVVTKVHSSQLTQGSTNSGVTGYSGSVPYNNCIFALSPANGTTHAMRIGGVSQGAGFSNFSVGCVGSATPDFEVFVFKPGGGGAISNGTGMEIYNSNGTLGFGTNYKPLRVLTVFDYAEDSGGESGLLWDTPADYASTWTGKRVACVFNTHARVFSGEGTFINRFTPYYTPFFRFNSSVFLASLEWYVDGNAGKDLPGWSRPGRYMLIDVTNY